MFDHQHLVAVAVLDVVALMHHKVRHQLVQNQDEYISKVEETYLRNEITSVHEMPENFYANLTLTYLAEDDRRPLVATVGLALVHTQLESQQTALLAALHFGYSTAQAS